jgi:hypothetical protein
MRQFGRAIRFCKLNSGKEKKMGTQFLMSFGVVINKTFLADMPGWSR